MSASNRRYSQDELVKAAKILDLPTSLDISSTEVNAQWKKLIGKMHPDIGGSTYLAGELNNARETLLGWIQSGRVTGSATGTSESHQKSRSYTEESDENKSQEYSRDSGGYRRYHNSPAPKKKRNISKGIGIVVAGLFVLGMIGRIAGSLGLIDISDHSWHFESTHEDNFTLNGIYKDLVNKNSEVIQLQLLCGKNDNDGSKLMILSLGGRNVTFDKATIIKNGDSIEPLGMSDDKSVVIFASRKTIETMTNDERLNAFGVSGAALFAKWLLSNTSKSQISDDIITAAKDWYKPAFLTGKVRLTATYNFGNKPFQYDEEINFDYNDDLRDKIFASCGVANVFR